MGLPPLPRFERRPLLACRAALALCRMAPPVADWRSKYPGRKPPMPYWGRKRNPDSGCPMCSWPVYRGGDWRPEVGPKRGNQFWHSCCAAAFRAMRLDWPLPQTILKRQAGRCGITGEVLTALAGYELDHRVPLWRVITEWEKHPWPECLAFWMPGNVWALSPAAHKAKTIREAADRAALRKQGKINGNSNSQG